MGQKVNPNIFRLGINKPWKTQFFEKKNQELPDYVFKDLELKTYIERFLELHGILLHDYRQQFNNFSITCYISYFVTPQYCFNLQNDLKEKKLLMRSDSSDNYKTVYKHKKKVIRSQVEASDSTSFESGFVENYKGRKSSLGLKNYLTKNNVQKTLSNNVSADYRVKVNGLFKQLFKVINLFTKNKYNIVFNFYCLNKKLDFDQLHLSNNKNLILLKKFKNTSFFKEGIEILFHVISDSSPAALLSKFIAIQIKTSKRQNFFFTFLKKTLNVLLNSSFSRISGVKILIKGRINGASKARHKTILIGRLPLQTLNKKIDFAQNFAHNSNGTYGIKVWVSLK